MSIDSSETPRQLPERPNLRHLKEQAKDLLRSGAAASTTDAQFQIARRYGFASWPKLKAHVEELVAADALQRALDREDSEEADRLMSRHPTLQAIVDRVCGVGSWVKMKACVAAQAVAAQTEVGQLKRAIDTEDFDRVAGMMTANPGLHRAPLGYGRSGPLTWVAECRVPSQPPSATRLAMAAWMVDNGSDVHQGGDGPLMRAALNGDRVPMMALLVARGASVNAMWDGKFPIIFASCEAVDPAALTWLLEHGADPNVTGSRRIPRNRARLRHRLVRPFAKAWRVHRCPLEEPGGEQSTTFRLCWTCSVADSIGSASSLSLIPPSSSADSGNSILERPAVEC